MKTYYINTMDEDTIFGIFFVVFLLIVFTLPLSITACIAAHTTRKWAKDKTRPELALDAEANPLVEESESEGEEDFLDSEDEAYYQAKKDQKRRERDEKEADRLLSTRAKFLKEWKNCWRGNGTVEQQRKERELKEQDERRKIAREAVRQYLTMERKKARKGQAKKESEMELPTYSNAVAEGAKR